MAYDANGTASDVTIRDKAIILNVIMTNYWEKIMNRNQNIQRQSGFTLLEILIVLGIIGAITAIVAGQVMGKGEQANAELAYTQIGQMQGAVTSFRQHTKRLPNNLQELVRKPSGVKRWVGPYVSETQLLDPWGNQYQYRKPGQNGPFDILSYGADGKSGGEGVNADIGNWQL